MQKIKYLCPDCRNVTDINAEQNSGFCVNCGYSFQNISMLNNESKIITPNVLITRNSKFACSARNFAVKIYNDKKEKVSDFKINNGEQKSIVCQPGIYTIIFQLGKQQTSPLVFIIRNECDRIEIETQIDTSSKWKTEIISNFRNIDNISLKDSQIQVIKEKSPKRGCGVVFVILCAIIFLFAIAICFRGNDSGNVTTTTIQTPITSISEERATTKLVKETTTDIQDFILSCKQLDYKAVARNPDQYKNIPVYTKGIVIQVSERSILFSDNTMLTLRINTTEGEYGFWEDTVYITYTLKPGESRILEDDMVTVYGNCQGVETYTSILGSSVTIPAIDAIKIVIN